jgi:hypothetical protein
VSILVSGKTGSLLKYLIFGAAVRRYRSKAWISSGVMADMGGCKKPGYREKEWVGLGGLEAVI